MKMGKSITRAVTYYQEPAKLYDICLDSVQAMNGIHISSLSDKDRFEYREVSHHI